MPFFSPYLPYRPFSTGDHMHDNEYCYEDDFQFHDYEAAVLAGVIEPDFPPEPTDDDPDIDDEFDEDDETPFEERYIPQTSYYRERQD
jgi:hypothetical protein